MRRMDYPIAKAKELNIFDEEWFLNPDQNNVYLKKKLPNGIYHLTGYSKIQEEINVNFYFKNIDSNNNIPAGHKALFLIPGIANNYDELKNLLSINGFADGLADGLPYFSINPNSPIFAEAELFIIIKDGIMFLTSQTDF